MNLKFQTIAKLGTTFTMTSVCLDTQRRIPRITTFKADTTDVVKMVRVVCSRKARVRREAGKYHQGVQHVSRSTETRGQKRNVPGGHVEIRD